MDLKSICIVLVLSIPTTTAVADEPIDLALAHTYFDEAQAISARDGGNLWGLELYGPMLFVDRATRLTVANQADTEGYLQPQGDVFVGTLPETVGIANTKSRWAGVEWTMLIWPLPDHEGSRHQLLAHEMFHRIQDDLELGLGIPDNRHLDSFDGRKWMRMEWRALREALSRDADERQQAIEDALVFRGLRHSLFEARTKDELTLELNEGLAEYTGISAGYTMMRDRFDRAISSLSRYDHHPNFIRSFAYASGPAYGLMLDTKDNDWRSRLSEKSDLGRLLAKAYRIQLPHPRNLQTEANARLEHYGGQEVIDEENARDKRTKAEQAVFKARFTDGPLLILPVSEFPSYTYDPNGVKAYGNKGSVYLTTRVVAEWGILNVTSGGALQVRKGQDIVRYVVPAPKSPDGDPVVGDGWTLTLNNGWHLARVGSKGRYIVRQEN